jgi:hypothetical protein
MRHHTFNWINKPDAAKFQVYYLSFKYSSTYLRRPHAHHQVLNNCSSSLWFYRRNVVIAVLLVVVGPTRPRPTALLPPSSDGKPEAGTADVVAPDNGLRCWSSAAVLLVLWVRIPPGAWMSFCCDCCVLSDRDLCVGLITRPEESYRQCGVSECDHESSIMRRPWLPGWGGGSWAMVKKY